MVQSLGANLLDQLELPHHYCQIATGDSLQSIPLS
jgi:hypothetical protein